MGTKEFVGTPKTLEFDCRGQNTLHCGVLYIIGKLSKRKCQKWARMSHLDIYSISYGKKKGRESKWQFDSRPLKVGNRPNPDACRWSATHRWKKLSTRATSLLQTSSQSERSEQRVMTPQNGGSPNRDNFKTPPWESQDKKAIWMQVPWRGTKNTIWGKVVASPESGPW
jgi:hypothetical protein